MNLLSAKNASAKVRKF